MADSQPFIDIPPLFFPRNECVDHLPAFSKHFDTLKSIHADLHPPLAAAVIKLSTLVQDIEQDMDFGELSLSQQHAFFQSKLYTQCSLRKVSARLLKVKEQHGVPCSERLAVVKDLLQHEVSEEQKGILCCAETMLSSIAEAEMSRFLLEDPQRLEHLEDWFGEHAASLPSFASFHNCEIHSGVPRGLFESRSPCGILCGSDSAGKSESSSERLLAGERVGSRVVRCIPFGACLFEADYFSLPGRVGESAWLLGWLLRFAVERQGRETAWFVLIWFQHAGAIILRFRNIEVAAQSHQVSARPWCLVYGSCPRRIPRNFLSLLLC